MDVPVSDICVGDCVYYFVGMPDGKFADGRPYMEGLVGGVSCTDLLVTHPGGSRTGMSREGWRVIPPQEESERIAALRQMLRMPGRIHRQCDDACCQHTHAP